MELRVNLKVCEACGCLWYRAQVETRVYCTSCQERFNEFPTAQSRKRRGRPRKIILPAVFAVEASAEGHNFDRAWFQPRHGASKPGQPSQPAEKLASKASQTFNPGQPAENPYQESFVKGHDFSRADRVNQIDGALAPEGMPFPAMAHLPAGAAFAGGAR